MSVENGKVCCNCRRRKLVVEFYGVNRERVVGDYCEVTKKPINYVQVHEGWCRHWAKEKEKEGATDGTTMDK